MKMKLVLLLTCSSMLLITCKQYRDAASGSVRSVKPNEVSAFHQPLTLTIAWVPYGEQKLVKTKKHEWKIVSNENEGKQGTVPVLLLIYPNSGDTVWLDMNTDSELLGKLLKHSLMTQEPVRRPFSDFFEVASCQKCHPADVKVRFD